MRTRSLAQRRYLCRLAIATMLYLIFLFLAVRLVGSGAVSGAVAYPLAALPGLAIIGVFWAMARLLIEETDEYQRMLLARQSLVATAFALSLASVWGFLESFGLVAHIDAFYIAILWFVGLGLGSVFNWVTVGDSGQCA